MVHRTQNQPELAVLWFRLSQSEPNTGVGKAYQQLVELRFVDLLSQIG